MAGLVCDTGYPLKLDIKKRDEPCVHPAFELARIIAEKPSPFKSDSPNRDFIAQPLENRRIAPM